VITFRRQPTTTSMPLFDIKTFMTDAMSRNSRTGTKPANGSPALNTAWFMTSVQAGFELWKGGAGAAGVNFGVAVN
jgi:hypothetical protein